MVNIWNHFCEYANGCTVHGVKYLAEPKRSWFEKLCWITAFVISISCCSQLIWDIWKKWDEFPVIVSFNQKATPVWEIPFPAVTICPQTKCNSEMLNFTEALDFFYGTPSSENFSETDSVKYKYLQSIIQTCDIDGDVLKAEEFEFGDKTIGIDIVENMINLERSKVYFFWRGSAIITQRILTNIGLCYTFNMLTQKEIFRDEEIQTNYSYIWLTDDEYTLNNSSWTINKGYEKNIEDELLDYPYRVFTANKKDSLYIIAATPEIDLDYVCAGPIQGFKVMFHTPNDIPQVQNNAHTVLFNQQASFKIKPKVSITSKTLDNLKPNKRQCFYDDESYLRFFKVYSQANCELECLVNLTMLICNCTRFSMPSIPEANICGAQSIGCYASVEYNIKKYAKELMKEQNEICNCLPTCNTINYEAEDENFDTDLVKFIKVVLDFDTSESELANHSLAVLTVMFDDGEFIASKRSNVYGFSEFISNCGGLLGVFMGISILSIVEVTYFFSIRLICNEELTKKVKGKEQEEAYPEFIEDDNNIEIMPSESQKIDME